jgi:hypothetical protein
MPSNVTSSDNLSETNVIPSNGDRYKSGSGPKAS